MRSAYNEEELYNLTVGKETRRWWKHDLISRPQLEAIRETHKCSLYHPNVIVRILLFIAATFASSGVSGLFFAFLGGIGTLGLSVVSGLAGAVFFITLEKGLINGSHHYKSGVTEAILYLACGYTIGGVTGLTDFDIHAMLLVCLVVFAGAAVRYLDLTCTFLSLCAFAGLLFFECYNLEGVFRQVIPFVFIVAFSIIYLVTKRLQKQSHLEIWKNNLLVVESLSLLLVYAGGNYLIVRELSIDLMDLSLAEGQDIPFAFLFYGLTIAIPILYLVAGIRRKDVVLLRVCLVVLAFSTFTFKYYYGFNRPEITLTVTGIILLIIAFMLFGYLKKVRGGFTRENLLGEKWANMNVAAFLVSQTMGGNQVKGNEGFKGGGGQFGGGGASGSF